MDLSMQVCLLELSKRLKELGYPQEGLWYRIKKINGDWDLVCFSDGVLEDTDEYTEKIVAPTVAELGEKLPDKYFTYKTMNKFPVADLLHEDCMPNVWCFTSDTEANARAKLWIYLKENNLLKEEDD